LARGGDDQEPRIKNQEPRNKALGNQKLSQHSALFERKVFCMSTSDERLTQVEALVAELVGRVAALEGQTPEQAPQAVFAGPDINPIEQLRNRSGPPYEQGDLSGAVTYAGVIRSPRSEYEWHIERPVPGLLALDSEPLARVLGALGNPARIQLVRALIEGPRTSHELQEALGMASPGQLYHHLKELQAVGIVEQRGRNDYRLSPRKIVPFLIMLAGALDTAADT
jgi:DNA-binding transcriptional ArsR family regulator